MYISSLSLCNFRNYTEETIELSPYTNVIYGDNAQGKTNILEAMYLFSYGKSYRAKSDNELIMFDKDFAKLTIEFQDSARDYHASMQLRKNGKKSVKVNNVAITKLSMLMNYLNVVMFSPADIDLVKGAPMVRRRFIDAAISSLSPYYLATLIEYQKILAQKNSLLKMLYQKKYDATLSLWNEQLAGAGAKIMKERRAFIESLAVLAENIQSEISNERLKIAYHPNIKKDNITKEIFFNHLEENQAREIERSSARYGIQRDDVDILINDKESKIYASQGQQRTAALSLKIAHADYIYDEKNEYPVMLLDDIMSELDIHRRTYLSKKIQNKQVLITSTDTDLKESTDTVRLFRVNAGRVISI